MKKDIFSSLLALLIAACIHAQPLVKADAIALLGELAPPPATLAQAYDRVYAGGNTADPHAFYKPWTDKLERIAKEQQAIAEQYYRQNPMGYQAPAATKTKASPQQQAAMDAATAELMKKMTSDPAFAQKFAAMSEQEQHAYIAELLAEKGLKPVAGQANTLAEMPAGSDRDWMGMCSELMQQSVDASQWSEYIALQQQYADEHAAINDWVSAEISKLPMYEYGEYGHDNSPEEVKAVQKAGLEKHRQAAARMLEQSLEYYALYVQHLKEQFTPLNEALKSVHYGENYAFGMHYQMVMGAQMTMLQGLNAAEQHAADIAAEAARWEYEWRQIQ
ncbi:MAG: hypothetical protein R2791_22095 [Saprospiraceae bacterium]